MSVDRVTTWEELCALQSDWNALAGDSPFRSWDWLATWWKHYGTASAESTSHNEAPRRKLFALVVFKDSNGSGNNERRLLGIAPWYIERSAIKGRVIKWLGDGEVCTDHLSLICGPEDIAEVAASISQSLTESDDWDALDLNAIDDGNIGLTSLVSSLQDSECSISRELADSCWALDLPSSWDDYLAALSKSHRKQLRQLERRVIESNRIDWHRVETQAELEKGWDILVDLHQRRRISLDEPGCFASAVFHSFHREVAERMLLRGQLRISWLDLDGKPAAAEYHFGDARATYAYQGGVDPDRLAEEPGRLSTILCLKQAIEEGHVCFDFLRGDEPYKAHWRATARPTWNYRVIPKRRLARIRGHVLNVAGTLGDWARQAVELSTSASRTGV
jgi:CelD/BcsL family acetyltransferase involved in cellulose biosynthesis